MSSILKALKRIEGQSPPPQSFPARPDSAGAKQDVNSNARRRWLLRRSIAVGLAVMVVAVIAVIVFQHRQIITSKIFPAGSPAVKQEKIKATVEKSKIFRAKISSETVKQALKRPEPAQPTGQQTEPLGAGQKSQKIRTTKNPSQSRAAVEQPTSKATPTISSKQLPSRTAGNPSAPKQSSRPELTPAKKSIAGKQAATSMPAAATPKDRKAKTYAKLSDSKIKLQALAWSSDAARRMAVINGRIVREGESMDGYQINQIRQEDVVVSDGSQSWSLKFGLKQ